MRKGYIVFDIGSGNTRAGLWTENNELLDVVRRDTVYHTDAFPHGPIYFEPKEWEAIFHDIIGDLMARKPDDVEVVAMSASSIRQSMVFIGEDGNTLFGLPNLDNYNLPYVQELDWGRISPISLLSPGYIYLGCKWYAMNKLHPEITAKTKTFCSISDWIGYLFTGNIGFSVSNLSQTALYDTEAGTWSPELCAAFGVPEDILPPIMTDGEIVGKIKPEYIEKYGFSKDAVYVMGIADTQAGMYGTDTEEGVICVVAGTSTPCVMPVSDFRKIGNMFVSLYVTKDSFMLENNAGMTGVNLMRFKNQFFPDKSFGQLNEACLSMGHMPRVLSVYAAGMCIEDVPIMHGGFLTEWQFRHDMVPEEWYYALSIDNGCATALSVNSLAEQTDYPHDFVRGCGGGVNSPIMSQTIANLTGRELVMYDNYDQATMYGCVKLCHAACGVEPKPRTVVARYTPKKDEALEQWFEDWKSFRECLRGMNGKWM